MVSREAERELCFMSIAELGEKIRNREISPVEVTEAMLSRIERHNDEMRVYITVTRDVAMEQARQAEREISDGYYRGPLHGVTVSLKDNVDTKDIRTTCGSSVEPPPPTQDATVYRKLREAGAILVGKANLYEYAFSITPAFPQPLNPWNPERSSQGSSSGSGAGVAAGMVHGSIGSDTGGSGRAPAHANGCVGFKATYGRVSRAGLFPLSFALDHTTMMTRTVRDSALMLQATSGYDPRDENSLDTPVPDFQAKIGRDIRGMRLGYAVGHTLQGFDTEVETTIRAAADVFRQLGATVEDVKLPYVEHCVALQSAIMLPEVAAIHYDLFRASADKLGASAVMRLDMGNVIPATAHIHAQRVRKLMRDAFAEMFQQYDAVIGPAMGMRSGRAGEWTSTVDGRQVDVRTVGPQYTGIYNLTGSPALVLPAGFSSEGTPLGLQVAGKWFDEATVLQVAHAYEQATEWHTLRPPYPREA